MKKHTIICFLIFGFTGFIALGQIEKPSGMLKRADCFFGKSKN
jgi:hypothetical protein